MPELQELGTAVAPFTLPPRVMRVMEIAAADYGLNVADLTSGEDREEISAARLVVISTLRRMNFNAIEIKFFLRPTVRPKRPKMPTPTDDEFTPLPPRVRGTMQRVATAHGVTIRQMQSPARPRQISQARGAAGRALHRLGFSLPEIGRFLHVHHTTVAYYINGRDGKLQAPRTPPPDEPDYSGEWAI
jgi:hypothetical protein